MFNILKNSPRIMEEDEHIELFWSLLMDELLGIIKILKKTRVKGQKIGP